jgi:adenylosuccinate synthase
MRVAVIGLGFGDEGKGMVTDYLCSQSHNAIVVRFSGGHQAGHTVVTEDKRHVFSNFGSGTLRNIPTYWSQFCTIEPIGLIRELQILLSMGLTPSLYIDERCPITTPYEIKHNQEIHELEKHGTCGVGFGATIEREENMHSITAIDLNYPAVLRIKLNLLQNYYKGYNVSLDEFYACIRKIIDSSNIIITSPIYNEDVIFEGSQGLLLDKDIGFFPHVTRANTGTKNILALDFKPDLYLVTRAYQTRHGDGIMTNESLPHNIIIDERETNKTNKYQGVFKRSLLDLDLLMYGINKDDYIRRNKIDATLVITCLDHITNEYRFTHKGNIIYCNNERDFIDKISQIIGINNLLLSRNPYSNELEPYQSIKQSHTNNRHRLVFAP